jgi:hypothetical protein
MALGDVIARLSVSLGLETAAFEKGGRRAAKETEALGKKMTRIAGAIGTAFVASIGVDTVRSMVEMGKAALDTVGALGEQAQQLGVTTDALQEFRFVASQTGIEQGEIDKALQRLTRTLGEIRDPTKAQTEALEKLGLSAKDLQGLTADQALVRLSAAFNKLPDAAAKSAVGFDLMGKSFQTLLPLLNEGPERIEAMVKAAHDLGIVLTPEQIADADKYADQIAALNASVDAQKAAALARYGEGLAKLTKDYTQFQIDLVEAFIAIDKAGNDFSEWNRNFGANTAAAFREVQHAIERTVARVVNLIGGTLSAMWDSAIAKINTVKRAFFGLYDAVVGHSYIPDMVDGIGAYMAQLDAKMVKPAEKATEATARKFHELRDLLDRLFPEAGKANQFSTDLAALEGSGLTGAALDEAVQRLWRETASGSPFGGGGMGSPDFGSDGGPLVEGMGATEDAIQRLTDRAKIGTVKIAESFKDMAEKTMASLSRLTSAIKGGDFLGILEGVIGLGLQLGSMGAFGSGVAGKLNSVSKIPKWANGTNFHPGGLALVGERGPELVSMPRGSRVTPNHAMGGVTNNYFSGNLLTPEFWAQINGGDTAAMQGGAALAGARNARSKKWALA